MKTPFLPLIALVASASLLSAEPLLDALDKSQRDEVIRGAQVLISQEMPGKPWPRYQIYQRVQATPEEVAAVFFDYPNAKGYIPKIFKSDISRRLSPCVIEVDYGLDIPILPDEFYTAKNSLTAGGDGSYTVSWILVRALQTKASEGSLRIEKFEDGSVIRYTNLVTPGSAMAGLLKMLGMEQIKNTVHAIVRQVEKQKKTNPEGLKDQVASLQDAILKEARK